MGCPSYGASWCRFPGCLRVCARAKVRGTRPISALRLWISEGSTHAESLFVWGGIVMTKWDFPEVLKF